MKMSFSSQGTLLSFPDLARMSTAVVPEGMGFKTLRLALEIFTVLLVLSPLARAQQPESPNATTNSDAGAQSQEQDSNVVIPQTQHPNPAGAPGLFAQALGGLVDEFSENLDLFRWGPISVRSFSLVEIYGQENLDAPPGQGQPQSRSGTSTELSTSIVLDQKIGRARLTVQYQPAFFITNGDFYTNAANENSSIAMQFPLSERWALTIADALNYYASNRIYTGPSIYSNYFSGTTFSNNFTSGPGSTLTNSTYAYASYQMTPRTTLSFGPGFGYAYATGYAFFTDTQNQQRLSSWTAGGNASLIHQITEEITVGATYSAQETFYTNTSKTAGPQQSSALQQTAKFTYRQEVTPTLWVSAGLGVLGNTTENTGTGFGLDLGVTKAFQRQALTLSYNRGFQFTGLITGYATDRFDVAHSVQWTQRLSNTTSSAYFRTISSSSYNQSGLYATEQVNYRLNSQLSLSGTFSYTKQIGDQVYLQSGSLRFFAVGLTWAPAVSLRPGT
jgi:hypothetical protein